MRIETQFVLLTVFPAPNPYKFVEWVFRESLLYELGMRRGPSCSPILHNMLYNYNNYDGLSTECCEL